MFKVEVDGVSVSLCERNGKCYIVCGDTRLRVSGMSCCGIASFVRYAEGVTGVPLYAAVRDWLNDRHEKDWKGRPH